MLTTFTDKMEKDYLHMGQDWEFARGKAVKILCSIGLLLKDLVSCGDSSVNKWEG